MKQSLKARIMNDKDFFEPIFAMRDEDKALTKVQEKYPEAIRYSHLCQRITFESAKMPGMFIWLDRTNGGMETTMLWVPSKEDDE